MDLNRVNFFDFLVFLTIVCQPFSAIYRPSILGYLASSPSNLLALIVVLFVFAFNFVRPQRQFSKSSLILLIWPVLLMPFYFLRYMDLGHLYKWFSIMILNLVWYSPLFFVKYVSVRLLNKAVGVSVVVAVLFIVAYDFLNLEFGKSIVFSENYLENITGKPRGSFEENSHLGVFLCRFIVLWFLLRNIRGKVSISSQGTMLLILLVLSAILQSKGLAITVVVSSLISLRSTKALGVFGIILFALSGFFETIIADFYIDLDNYTSLSTRLALSITSVRLFAANIIGVGTFGFYPAFQNHLGEVLDILAVYPLNLTEVEDILHSGINLSSKSTLLDQVSIGGIPFIIIFYRWLFKVDYSTQINRFAVAILLLTSFYTSGNSTFSFFFLLSVLTFKLKSTTYENFTLR